MLRFILKSEKYPIIIMCIATLIFGLLAPHTPEYRVWWGLSFSLFLPILVVGRSHKRLNQGWYGTAMLHSRRSRLIMSDWLLSCVYALIFGVAVSLGHGPSLCAMFAWAFLILSVADGFDRTFVKPSTVWVWTLLVVLSLTASPVLMAPMYGNTAFAPYVVTYTVGLHPGAMYLAAHELPTLQNPILYAVSLSGVIEAYPVRWHFGAGTYFTLAVVLIAWSFVSPLRRTHLLR